MAFTHTLDRLGHEDEVDAGRYGARVFHHVGDELAQQAVEFLVDLVVLLQHFQRLGGVQAGKGIERLAQLGNRQVGFEAEVGHRQAQPGRHTGVDQPLHRAGDARGFVTDTLQIGDGLADRNQQPQVARGGLAAGDDGREIAVDFDFHLVDALFLLQHMGGGFFAEVRQRVNGLRNLRFNQAAHLKHTA